MGNETDNSESAKKKTKKEKKSFLVPALIISVSLFLVLLIAVVWIAAKKPLILKQLIIETNVSTVVKEILPASEYVSLIYNYQSITQRTFNQGSWLNARNLLVVLDGTIKLGFNCEKITVKESGTRIIISMPPVEILAHEQYPERARSYELAGGGFFPRTVQPQEILDLLGDSKLEQEVMVKANDELMKQARDSAETLFKPLLELNPSISGNYTINFVW